MLSFLRKNYRAIAGVVAGVLGVLGVVIYRARRAGSAFGELRAVRHVDIGRYMGKWYEIARYPVAFEQDCYGPAFEYTLRPDGKILVLNTCRKGSFDGPMSFSEGIATITDTRTNAKFDMQSFWPFSRDYWIIDLDQNYQYAVISSADKSALWILSRTPYLDDETYRRIEARLAAEGFDPAKLYRPPQPKKVPAEVH